MKRVYVVYQKQVKAFCPDIQTLSKRVENMMHSGLLLTNFEVFV